MKKNRQFIIGYRVIVLFVIFTVPVLLSVAACTDTRASYANRTKSAIGKQYTAEELVSDLDDLFAYIERTHPDPYHYTNREAILAMRSNAVRRIEAEAPMDDLDFWAIVSPVVMALHDHHTSVGYSDGHNWNNDLPVMCGLGLTRVGTNVYIKYGDADVKDFIGKRLVSIGGVPTYEILSNLAAHDWYFQDCYPEEYAKISVTPHVDYVKHAFAIYSLYGFHDRVRLAIDTGNGIAFKTIQFFSLNHFIEGIKHHTIGNFYSYSNAEPHIPYVFTKRWNDVYFFTTFTNHTGYLCVHNFSMDTAKSANYLAKIKADFVKLQDKNSPILILDITGNEGGSDLVWAALFAYLHPSPFRMNGNAGPDENLTLPDLKDMLVRSGLCATNFDPEWEKYAFHGKVYLLVSGGVFSSAVSFAEAMKYYKAATLVGCETGGWATHFGEVKTTFLPNSGLYVRCSSKFFRALDGDLSPHGVIPDVELDYNYTNIADYWSPGRETVYSKVMELIRADWAR